MQHNKTSYFYAQYGYNVGYEERGNHQVLGTFTRNQENKVTLTFLYPYRCSITYEDACSNSSLSFHIAPVVGRLARSLSYLQQYPNDCRRAWKRITVRNTGAPPTLAKRRQDFGDWWAEKAEENLTPGEVNLLLSLMEQWPVGQQPPFVTAALPQMATNVLNHNLN